MRKEATGEDRVQPERMFTQNFVRRVADHEVKSFLGVTVSKLKLGKVEKADVVEEPSRMWKSLPNSQPRVSPHAPA